MRYQQNNQFSEAINVYDNSLQINPNQELGWTLKSSALMLQLKPYEAMQALDKALQINPNYSLALYGKSMISCT